MILCLAANPSVDRLFEVERLVPGGIHRPTGFTQVPGGKGLNVARAAAALGAEVSAAALLGGHAGRWIADGLEAEGIPFHAAWAEAETRSSLSVAGAAAGLTEFYERGGPVSSGEWAAFAGMVRPLVAEAAWTTLSGSVPAGAPAAAYDELAQLGRCALDADPAGLEATYAVVKLNAAEAAQATGSPIPDTHAAARAATALRRRFGGAAVVTRGSDGAVLATPDGDLLEGRLEVVGRYPVGSGDAFMAGLVVALDRGGDWTSALRSALGAGAANAEQPGAARLSRSRAEELERVAAVRRIGETGTTSRLSSRS